MSLNEILDQAPENDSIILESIVLTHQKLQRYDNILCTISGGSDSDILLDLCQRVKETDNITYVFFDTGLEFKATKKHLAYLEDKYGISIERVKAIKSIPTCCREFGQPFLSKQVSEWISRLQRHNFKWEDKPFDVLYEEYPNCKAALRWWCNDFKRENNEGESSFNIAYNKYLKEFMIENPPNFRISNKCCSYAKKKVVDKFKSEGLYDLNIYGVRKSEGGVRRSAYKTCFSSSAASIDEFRPIFWYLSETKRMYESHYGVQHSDCYSIYGLRRTGCAGCPFGRNFEQELDVMEKHEPKMHKAVTNVFREAYQYTRAYKKFVEEKKKSERK